LLKKKKKAFCTRIIRKLRTTQKRTTKSIKDLDHYKRVFCNYCCYFKENNLHSLERWKMRQDVFSMPSKKRNINMATNFPFTINIYPKTLKVIFGKQKKVLHSLILWIVNLQSAWSRTVKQDDNISMMKKPLKSVFHKLCSTEPDQRDMDRFWGKNRFL